MVLLIKIYNPQNSLKNLQLEKQTVDIKRQLIEAFAIQKYRTRQFTAFQGGKLLGHTSRWETDLFLKKNHCYGYTEEDFEQDSKTLDKLFKETNQ